ncbi:MAG: tripartite tricarboxylate transporter substrate binding protein [Pseudomonadota bacterium]
MQARKSPLRWAGIALAGVLCAWTMAPAAAQESRMMRMVTPAPPGGNLDNTARLLTSRLPAVTGDTWMVDNRPGGNTVIGIEAVVRAQPDGRTVLYHATAMAMLSWTHKLSFSPLDDLVPVVQVSTERYAVVVPIASAVTSLRALEEAAASREGGLNCISAPGVSNMACEQFRARVRGRSTTIPYAGVAPALQATVAGLGDVMFCNFESVTRMVEAGRVRIIGVSSAHHLAPVYARLPVINDVWPEFVIEGFSGIFVPAATPAARVRELVRDVNRVLADPEVAKVMRDSGQEPVGGTSEDFSKVLRRSSQRYGEVIQRLSLGVK